MNDLYIADKLDAGAEFSGNGDLIISGLHGRAAIYAKGQWTYVEAL